jgi:hypothetical protein
MLATRAASPMYLGIADVALERDPGKYYSIFMSLEYDLQSEKKAFEINMDPRIYGVFAEIGAGQEVARRFFSVGGAAGTVAKSISAYDMTFSDAIYGACGRYVSRARLHSMLTHEYSLLIERLDAKVGGVRTFFAFADTVAARSFRGHAESHGWMGIRFQTEPRGGTNEIIIHVRMLDPHNLQQQEALGIVGVNLIYGAFYLTKNPETLVGALLDDLAPGRIEVDMIRFTGPDFADVDDRIMALQLVTQNLTNAALFRADGEIVNAGDALYKKPLLVERGSFRPVTLVADDMLNCARAMFMREESVKDAQPEILMEITMKDLEGGILEALGRLFKTGVKLYVYPFLNPNGELVTVHNFEVAPNLAHLYTHLLENGFIEAVQGHNPSYLPVKSSVVLAKIRAGAAGWEKMVSPEVARIIKERRLFGFQPELAGKN